MDKLTKEQRRKNMQANKSTGTKPELSYDFGAKKSRKIY